MIIYLKKIIKKIINIIFINKNINSTNIFFSQEGEDIVLKRIFENKPNGFYIDIGAHHPKRFSNTYLFYLNGWRGINLDPIPGVMKIFEKYRPLDINLEYGISNENCELFYYNFKEKAFNTFSEDIANIYLNLNIKLVDKIKIKTFKLEEILSKYLPINNEIDFLSIDVEGLELSVLKSNNWDLYKPKIILVEILDVDFENLISNNVIQYLGTLNYKIFAKTLNTVFLKL